MIIFLKVFFWNMKPQVVFTGPIKYVPHIKHQIFGKKLRKTLLNLPKFETQVLDT